MTHIDKASNMNKIITMTSWQNKDILILIKSDNQKILIWSYLGVALSTCNIQDNFTSYRYIYSHKTQTSL